MSTEKEKMLRGELYLAFTPELEAERTRCANACQRYNAAEPSSKLENINLYREIFCQPPLPESTPEDVLDKCPNIGRPFFADYGYNTHIADTAFINFNCCILDTGKVTIGARTLLGPYISLFAAGHPLDAALRNGTQGPEWGKDIVIGEDCWLGGSCIILAGVTLGRGVIVGAGAVVTKSVPDYCVVVGNPARIVKRLPGADPEPAQAAKGKEDVKSLMERMEKLEIEMKEVKEKLKEKLQEP